MALALGSALAPAPLQAQSPTTYVYLIDTSGSMEGLPAGSGNAVIFPRVKAELLRQLEDMEAGERVEFRTFDEGIQSEAAFDMGSPSGRQEARRFVEGLEARGQSTWVYRSILDAARDRRAASGPASPAVFYVFTDGVDNDPQGASMREMLEEFGELRRENDYLVYVTLGVDLPAADSAAFDEQEWGVLQKQPEGVLRLGIVQVRATHLNFGVVEGEMSNPRSMALRLTGVEEDSVRLRIDPVFPEIQAAGGVVETEPVVADFDDAGRLRLRIINRESVPEGVFRGVLHLSAEQPYVQVLPSRLTATLSTVPLPTATLLDVGEEGFDFGEWRIGDGAPNEAQARVELSPGARTGEHGFYLEINPDSTTTVVPSAAWNGQPVNDGDFLTSTERLNDLVFSWPQPPTDDGPMAGEIRLHSGDVEMGTSGTASSDEGVVVPWRLQVLPAPMPRWLLAVYAFAALTILALLAVLLIKANRPFFVRIGMASPRLHGRLVYEPSGENAQEVPLTGSRVRIGLNTDHLPELPDEIEIAAKVRDGKECVTATCAEGDAQYRQDGAYTTEFLDGQALGQYDVLVMSDKKEVRFMK